MHQPRKRRRRKKLLLLLPLVIIGGGFGFKWFRPTDDSIQVQVEKAALRDLTEIVVANGRIHPITQVTINPEVAGEIIELPVEEGQRVKKGDLLVQIRPDNYEASRNSAEANHKYALGAKNQAEAELERAEADFKRNEELAKSKLISASVFQEFTTAHQLARLRLQNADHQADQARFALDKAIEELGKTRIVSPIDGTITKLKSQLGERVLGTSFNMGTEIMTVAQLEQMEARVDIGEVDIVLIEVGQKAHVEVDAFRDRKFSGTVSAIANASKNSGSQTQLSSAQNQEAPKFEVRILIADKEAFRPGMSVTAEIETRSRKGVVTVPIQSVTTRLAKPDSSKTAEGGKPAAPVKPSEVVFALEGDHLKMLPVKTGISDNDHFEIVSGVTEGQQIVTGGYQAISKDLEDGKKVRIGVEAPKKP